MGHDFAPSLQALIADSIAAHTRRVRILRKADAAAAPPAQAIDTTSA
jgi:hypothetical protein